MKYERRLLSEALRSDPEILITQKRFWKPGVFALLLEACRERLGEDPAAALSLAKLAPTLARRVAQLDVVADESLLLFRAYCIQGSAERAVADFRAANETYEKAARLNVPHIEHTDLLRRRAYLAMACRDRGAARALIQQAVLIHRLEGDLIDRHQLGRCLLAWGQIEYELGDAEDSIAHITSALNHLDVRQDHHTYYAALHNLTVSLIDAHNSERLAEALRNLKNAHRLLGVLKRRHVYRYKLWWLQGVIHLKLGARGKAEELLRKARHHLRELGSVPYEVGVISLDLASLLLSSGRTREALLVARDTYQHFQQLDVGREALAALSLLTTALTEQRLTDELATSLRKRLTTLASPV